MPEKANEYEKHHSHGQRCHRGTKSLAAARQRFMSEQTLGTKDTHHQHIHPLMAAACANLHRITAAHTGDGTLPGSFACWQPGADEHRQQRKHHCQQKPQR